MLPFGRFWDVEFPRHRVLPAGFEFSRGHRPQNPAAWKVDFIAHHLAHDSAPQAAARHFAHEHERAGVCPRHSREIEKGILLLVLTDGTFDAGGPARRKPA